MKETYAHTQRLRLRTLQERDLPRYAALIGDWDVTRWLFHVPHPYTESDARWWFDQMNASYASGEPESFVIADRKTDDVLGAIGFHPPSVPTPDEGEIVLGYWLGKPYWGQGLMSEAVAAALPLAYGRTSVAKITTFTDIDNRASQNVLRKAGFRYLGVHPRQEQNCFRGSDHVTRWELLNDTAQQAQARTG